MSDTSKRESMFVPKRSERLCNVVNQKLKIHLQVVEYSDTSSDEDNNEITILATSQNGTTVNTHGDSTLTKNYLMWQNNANVCWLDASMALLVHNQTLIQSINESSKAQIANIIHHYYKAISILNDCSDSKHIDERASDAKDMLKAVQESALKYLLPIVKYKEGEPDSAFCSLFNLITEDKAVKDLFEVEYTWVQVCNHCKTHRAKKHRKPIVTLPRVEDFQPSSPISLYQCLVCKAADQKMTLNFRTLPQCLLFHFERGAGKGELKSSNFEVDGRTYQLTGVMKLEKGKDFDLNHFVTFIRNPSTEMWLECNDLNVDIMNYAALTPYIALQDVYIIMFEAYDGKGTVSNRSLAADKRGLGEESVSGSEDIPLIDLVDDAEKDGTERRRGTSDKTINYNDGNVNKYLIRNMKLEANKLLLSSCESGNEFLEEAENDGPCERMLGCDESLNYDVFNDDINSKPLQSNSETGIEIFYVPDCFCDMKMELVSMVVDNIFYGMYSFSGRERF